MTYTGLQLSEKILRETKMPMNPQEMWRYAVEKGYDLETSINGKTPWNTLGAQIYTNIQKSPNTVFVKVSTHPQKFGLKEFTYDIEEIESESVPKDDNKIEERDLHRLLVAYVNADSHFQALTKTIFHESSKKKWKNGEKWMHPDLVSVHLPFDDLNLSTVELATRTGINTVTIYSFEMKKELTRSTVRECYFQAVSNSSWANEGYLVAPVITEQALDELARLNASFGIGVIRLDVDDVHQSEIILPSNERELDIGMIDDLSRINPDFADFIKLINGSMKAGMLVNGKYDKVEDDEELRKFIIEKKIDTLKI